MVRAAGERDLDRLAEIFLLLLADQREYDPSFALGAGAREGVRKLLEVRLRAPDVCFLVAERGAGAAALQYGGDDAPPAQLVGFCLAALARRPNFFQESLRGEIEHLFVRSETRRAGVGSALVREAFTWLAERGAARVALEVSRANRTGRAFWEALRFRPAMDVLERAL